MKKVEVGHFKLNVSQEKFVEMFWENEFHRLFSENVIKEENVKLTAWQNLSDSEMNKFQRNVSCCHPMPVKLPWLPQYALNSAVQTISYDEATKTIEIEQISTVNGIPWIEPKLITEWKITQPSPEECLCSVLLAFEYDYPSWLESAVEMNSHRELLHYFSKWHEVATNHINSQSFNSKANLTTLKALFPATIVSVDPLNGTSAIIEPNFINREQTQENVNATVLPINDNGPQLHMGNNTNSDSFRDKRFGKRVGVSFLSLRQSIENTLEVSKRLSWEDLDLWKLTLFMVLVFSYRNVTIFGLFGALYWLCKVTLAIYCGITFSDFVVEVFTEPKKLSSVKVPDSTPSEEGSPRIDTVDSLSDSDAEDLHQQTWRCVEDSELSEDSASR